MIWFGGASKSSESSIRVCSPFITATATFALNAGLKVRRGRLATVFHALAASCRRWQKIHLYRLFSVPEPPLTIVSPGHDPMQRIGQNIVVVACC